MSGELSHLKVLVTGASRGIGLATSRLLAERGAWVGMVARGEAGLTQAAASIGGVAFVADVTSAGGVAQMAAQVTETIGGAPDVLVNSAGSFTIAAFADTTPEEFAAQLAVNLTAPFLTTRAFLPVMLKRRSGHVVNVGSIAGRLALPGNSAYSASKFGLQGLHQVLAVELQGSGVRTTMIEPAATDTPLWDPLDPDSRSDLPHRAQMMRPETVARAIVFAIAQPAEVEISYLAMKANG